MPAGLPLRRARCSLQAMHAKAVASCVVLCAVRACRQDPDAWRRSRASHRRDRGRSLRCAGLAQVPGRRAQAVMETGEGSGLPAKCAFRLARINAVAAVRDSARARRHAA